MKKYFLIFFFQTIFINQVIFNQDNGCKRGILSSTEYSDSAMLQKLKEIDKSIFLRQPVDSFLKHNVFSEYKSYAFIDEPYGLLNHVSFKYSKKIIIELRIKEYKYVMQSSDYRKWKFEDFIKEKISRIDLIYDFEIVQQVGN
jgi:hypothetical protein